MGRISQANVKFLFKSLCVFSILILLMVVLNKIFINKLILFQAVNSDVTELPYLPEKWDGFYEKDKNTIDMLFVGTSVVHTGVDVNYLYHEYGFTSYDLSADQMSSQNVYAFLKEALKYQVPKVVFVDVQSLSWAEAASATSLHYNYDFMHQGINRIKGIKENKNVSSEGNLFPFLEYHTRWEELNETDFCYLFQDKLNMLNGYFIYMLTNAAAVPATYEKTQDTLSELGYTYTEENLNKIISLCNEKGMKCILFRTPQSYTENQAKYCNAIEKYAIENEVDFWNFNDYYSEIGVDFSTDFVDGQHLNYIGSRKFTAFLGTMIAEQLEYTDHRGMDGYEEWDVAYDYENYLIHAYEIRHYGNFQEYLDYNDFLSDDLVYMYTYRYLGDLQKIPGMPVKIYEMEDKEGDSKVCIMEKGEMIQRILLFQGDTYEGLLEQAERLFIESFDAKTKIWVDDHGTETKEADGIVDLLIYDKKLRKVLDHVILNTNNEFAVTHL